MASIVLDLQKEILSPNCDIVNVLRKAQLIAVKLNILMKYHVQNIERFEVF
mgnify:CR=1 FL=1